MHDQVEAAMDSAALMKPGFSPNEYELLLKRLWWAHSALEPVIEECEPIAQHPDLNSDDRLGKRKLLSQDLEEMGVSTEKLQQAPLALLSNEECWGALYVLEGSTLGGAMIYKKLKEQEDSSFPLRFYGAYGRKTGAMWSSFREAFTQSTVPVKEWKSPVTRGAEKAYGSFLKAARQFQP